MMDPNQVAESDTHDRPSVLFYTKPGCHLCDDVLAQLHKMQIEVDFHVVERNIELSQDDFERYQHLVPVLDIPGSELLYPPHDINVIRQAIDAATPDTRD